MAALKLKIKKTLLKRKVDGVTFGMEDVRCKM